MVRINRNLSVSRSSVPERMEAGSIMDKVAGKERSQDKNFCSNCNKVEAMSNTLSGAS
jgi:hypothetical protein